MLLRNNSIKYFLPRKNGVTYVFDSKRKSKLPKQKLAHDTENGKTIRMVRFEYDM